nr:M48 family metalloprotease [Corticibacter populi]
MKLRMKDTLWPAAMTLVCVAWLTGCNVMDNPALMQAGGSALRAVALTDAEVIQLSTQSCAAMDAQNHLASSGSAYARQLSQVVAPLPRTINDQAVNFKLYQTQEVNAWPMDNGCVRVYTGPMDLMNDDELRGVIAHEMGHVALGHSRAGMRTAYATSAV